MQAARARGWYGVILTALKPIEGETQRLFGDDLYKKDRVLMKVMDKLNAR